MLDSSWTRVCWGCKETKDLNGFGNCAAEKDGKTYLCKQCSYARNKVYRQKHQAKFTAYAKQWLLDHPERAKAIRWKRHLKRQYKLTPEQYQTIWDKQHGLCAICNRPPAKNDPLCLDHDHATLEIRELIHRKCNSLLGMVNDIPEWLEAAKQYLLKHQRKVAA